MKTAFVNGYILDGTMDMTPQSGKVLLIKDEKIEAIVEQGTDISGYRVIDLQGKYILPGLINLHVHTPGSGKPSKKKMDLEKICKLITSCAPARAVGHKMIESNMKNAVMAGITTVRTVGGIADFDSYVRNKINRGRCIGPRILAADLAISVPGGHMAGTFAHIAHNVEEAKNLVDEIAKAKPDLIKLMITGGVMDSEEIGKPGKLLMPPEYVKAATDRAHELGYPVAAHCEGDVGVQVALEYGVDTIEHGCKPTPEILKLFRETGAAQVVTISPALPYALKFPGLLNFSEGEAGNMAEIATVNSQALLDGMIELAKQNLAAGVPVGLGTDTSCSYSTQYDMWRELCYFVKYCEVTPAFALHTATLINAQIAGIADVTGSIEPGKMADLMVVDQNPLEDLTTLRSARIVVTRGRILDKPKVKKFQDVEDVLDRLL